MEQGSARWYLLACEGGSCPCVDVAGSLASPGFARSSDEKEDALSMKQPTGDPILGNPVIPWFKGILMVTRCGKKHGLAEASKYLVALTGRMDSWRGD